uniref:Uncharacterized protein n=1 Tax=Anopheles albimanus TaxID=7167 RepID=A0A182FXE6_ANOAL
MCGWRRPVQCTSGVEKYLLQYNRGTGDHLTVNGEESGTRAFQANQSEPTVSM